MQPPSVSFYMRDQTTLMMEYLAKQKKKKKLAFYLISFMYKKLPKKKN